MKSDKIVIGKERGVTMKEDKRGWVRNFMLIHVLSEKRIIELPHRMELIERN